MTMNNSQKIKTLLISQLWVCCCIFLLQNDVSCGAQGFTLLHHQGIARPPPAATDAITGCFATTASSKKKKSKKTLASGGFGAGAGSNQKTPSSSKKNKKKQNQHKSAPVATTLSPQAMSLLEKHQNNVNAASQDYFETRMMAQYKEFKKLSSRELKHSYQQEEEDPFLYRMSAKWDTVALFMPLDYQRNKGKVEPYVQRRLQHICHAATSPTLLGATKQALQPRSILDVGCGDAAIYPFLERAASVHHGTEQQQPLQYWGLDVSPVMIDMARQRYGGSFHHHSLSSPQDETIRFDVGSFPQHVVHTSMMDRLPFNCILFNGSLQFFHDPLQVIKEAAMLLKANDEAQQPRGIASDNDVPLSRIPPRIVISHVNGAKFVRSECRTNADVAVSHMPTLEQLQGLVDGDQEMAGWTVVHQEALVESSAAVASSLHAKNNNKGSNNNPDNATVQASDINPDSFYLVALEKRV